MATTKAKTKAVWKPGAKVAIGGRDYVVLRREEAKKGKPWVIQSADGSRTYEWRAFHGLTLTSGQPLVRPRVRAAEKAPVTTGASAGRETDILNLVIDDIRQNPRRGSGRFLARVLAALGLDTDGGEETSSSPRADGPDLPAAGSR